MKIGFASPLVVAELLPWLDVESGDSLPAGLGGPNATTLLRGLLHEGHQVVAVTLDPLLETPIVLKGDQLTLHIGPYRPHHRARDYFRHERAFVRSALSGERPDVIGAQWSYEFALGSLETHTPTVVSLQDWAPRIMRFVDWKVAPYYAVRLAMHSHALVRAAALTANSPVIARRAERWVRRPVPVVPNAFSDDLFDNPGRRPMLGRPLVLAANNGFNRLKNTSALLQAFLAVRRAVPAARLELAGEGHGPGGAAEQWAQERGLAGGVMFLGLIPQDELLIRMRAADLFVHASREESFGNVLVEAMSQGTPTIGGRNSGAVPWVLDEGRAGLLTDVEDHRVLAHDMISILTDPARWESLSASGRRISKERFSVSNAVVAYVTVLNDCLALSLGK